MKSVSDLKTDSRTKSQIILQEMLQAHSAIPYYCLEHTNTVYLFKCITVWISLGFVFFAGIFLHKISVCRNVALQECLYRTDVDYLCYEYNVNFSLSLSVINDYVYSKFGDICGM